MPQALERLALDTQAQGGRVYLSLPSEAEITPAVVTTRAAWEALGAWTAALIRAYCEGREALQVANGDRPDPAPICREPAR